MYTQTTDGGVVIRGGSTVGGHGVGVGVGGRHTSASGVGVGVGVGSTGVRRSLPNMATSHLLHEPAKLYPYHLLLITNYRLPPDVDRLNLEVTKHFSLLQFWMIIGVQILVLYKCFIFVLLDKK